MLCLLTFYSKLKKILKLTLKSENVHVVLDYLPLKKNLSLLQTVPYPLLSPPLFKTTIILSFSFVMSLLIFNINIKLK